jgi:glycosyltransferase involved in cell wall biosynthesis
LLKDKGVYEFVEAARIIRSREADAKLHMVLVGAIDPHNSSSISQREVESWTKEGSVIEAMGQVGDMAAVYQRCHVVVLPSYREGLPKVLIEAGASGRASITTDVPGCREIVKHGINGLIVPAKDAAALADAIQKLMKDRPLRHALARRAHQIVVDEYDVRHVVGKTLSLYDEIVSERCASS